ncbi:chloride channel protein [Ectothiorhodospiraceae bacterium WFHF3C12]|nr:chloride channel protein [Ectothiorhodospiraceae bacterium WFHF3C12]
MLICALGALTGLLAGGVIIGFRFAVELTQASFLPGSHHEGYESLAPHWRVAVATGGALAVGLLMRFVIGPDRRTGVAHVIERVVFHQSVLPLRNAMGQLIGGALSIISGHSVGREGPSVHLGAATGSQLGQLIELPNNSLRTLIACGTAAAIGASFNTPLAGVAFAMEVVVMEYTIAGFLPVILSAVTATALTQFFFGAAPAFSIPPLNIRGLVEIPHVIITGMVMGALAAAFIHALRIFSGTLKDRTVVLRMTLGGLGVGVIAIAAPEVMGIGYDTVDAALHGEIELGLLAVIVIAKLAATAWVLGMGLPGGLIGPTLVIGAAGGGALGYIGALVSPVPIAGPAFYALIGMGAMMGATLRAPLAALTAMLELTANPNVIMPGMLAIVAATLTTSELFRTDSVFLAFLRSQGLDPRRNPLQHAFSRLGIARVMDRRLIVLPKVVEREDLDRALREDPRWIVVEEDTQKGPIALVPVTDVLQYVQETPGDDPVDLMEIPAQRLQPSPIEVRASLREALERLRRDKAEALYVTQTTAPGIRRYYGVVTRGDIESKYLG